MKCISLIQPWASLVISGAKKFETRSWKTYHRGPLLIASSKRMPESAKALCLTEPFASALQWVRGEGSPPEPLLPLGVILGFVTLEDCLNTRDVAERLQTEDPRELAFGDYRFGRYAWRLSQPSPLVVPVVYSGRLGLYEVPDSVLFGDTVANTTEPPSTDGKRSDCP